MTSTSFPSGWGSKLQTHEAIDEQYCFSLLILVDFFTAFVPGELALLPDSLRPSFPKHHSLCQWIFFFILFSWFFFYLPLTLGVPEGSFRFLVFSAHTASLPTAPSPRLQLCPEVMYQTSVLSLERNCYPYLPGKTPGSPGARARAHTHGRRDISKSEPIVFLSNLLFL